MRYKISQRYQRLQCQIRDYLLIESFVAVCNNTVMIRTNKKSSEKS